MTTKHIWIGWVTASLLLTGCITVAPLRQEVSGSGVLAAETRTFGQFTTIVFATSGEADVVLGEPEGIIIQAEDNLLPYLTTHVAWGRLTIGTQPNINLTPTQPIHYTITLKQLEGIDLAGSGTLRVPEVSADQLKLEIHGSGNIVAAGVTDKLEAMLFGSGNITSEDLQARSAWVEIPGSGNIVVWATDQLNAVITGSGTVSYYGQPSVTEDIHGFGNVVGLGDK